MPSTAITYTFSPNTRIKSAEVNQNFTDNQTFVGVAVYLGSTQSNITQASDVLIQLDTELFDVGNDFNTGTYLFTTPVNGFYFIHGQLTISSGDITADKRYGIRIYKNGTGGTRLYEHFAHSSLISSLSVAVSGIVELVAGDTISMYARVDPGNNNADIVGTDENTYLNIAFMGI